MTIAICKKSKLYDMYDDVAFVCPKLDDISSPNNSEECIKQYHTIDNDRPITGDFLVVNHLPYKVYQTIFDCDKKVLYVIVEEVFGWVHQT